MCFLVFFHVSRPDASEIAMRQGHFEPQDEVRRLELELLRARSGRAIVERQLGEAQVGSRRLDSSAFRPPASCDQRVFA